MKVFVTGSTGLFGTNLVHALLREGHTVRALARSPEKAARVLPPDAEAVSGDIADVAAFAPALRGCDAVIHAAAYFREYYGRGDHETELRRLNVDATVDLARAAASAGVARFVFISSSGTLGTRADGSASDETDAPNGRALDNLYFRSKWEAELALQRADLGDIRRVTILPGWMFGPHDTGPTGAGYQVQEFLRTGVARVVNGVVTIADARDVAQATVTALTRGRHGERYAVAGVPGSFAEAMRAIRDAAGFGRVITVPYRAALALGTVLEGVTRITGKTNPIPVEGVRTLHDGVTISSAKAERELGATFRPFSETARSTVDWFLKNSDPRHLHRDAPKLVTV